LTGLGHPEKSPLRKSILQGRSGFLVYLKIRSSVKWKTIRRLPLLLNLLWLRLRHQWQYNPGYVAATVAGTLGLILTFSLLIQTGLSLLTDDSEVDESAIESDEFADDNLGESGSEQRALIARLRAQDREAARLNAALDDADADETTDPFGDPLPQVSRATSQPESRMDEETADDDAEAEPEPPARNVTKSVPIARPHLLESTDDIAEEPSAPARPVFEPARLKVAEQTEQTDDDEVPLPVVRQEPEKEDDDGVAYRRFGDLAGRQKQWQPTADSSVSDTKIQNDEAEYDPNANKLPEYQPAAASIAARRRSSPAETVVVPARIAPPPAAIRSREPKTVDSGFPVTVAISGPPSASLDQTCDVEVRLTNNSSQIVRNLVISLELPSGLRHPVGQSLEQVVEALPPGKTHRAVVHVRPRQTGTMVVQAEVAAGDSANVKLRTSVAVGTQTGRTATAAGCLPCIE
jgi:hypothetical protein